ncbi:DUF2165 family protein [Pseudidiomarina terrestris]|uniref:DUF2165 family protein n=1 Tax=Pseudidiomarina terrestris TaxID=2820060 RepID=A0AAW7QZC8_9GAMM|nr:MULTISPECIES: DUF2165 family protein [unclassified Pseudidiomarina]MDN7123916.1 DUF2165 family protein [Pseudidiomarina sp. 1APP75-32.1]MDN7130416.1 DUF2165 family protein [Pseudidiomarina sp. 1APR75-15]MDN7136339.1 DUF2165 family protein [Pseudidiomarina sp. 1ASP75-5]MDN7138744.1 DUF2165 family protein [Pseudidiomarina sp. 1ASP75-14]
MTLRWIKVLLVLSMGLMCLFYALQNIANLDAVYYFVGSVLTMADHEYYPNTFAFAVEGNGLIQVASWIIILLEALAGLLFLFAAWLLIKQINSPAIVFQKTKSMTFIAAGVATLVWFGLFHVLGGAFFQMWQTPLGDSAFKGSFTYFASILLITFFVNLHED